MPSIVIPVSIAVTITFPFPRSGPRLLTVSVPTTAIIVPIPIAPTSVAISLPLATKIIVTIVAGSRPCRLTIAITVATVCPATRFAVVVTRTPTRTWALVALSICFIVAITTGRIRERDIILPRKLLQLGYILFLDWYRDTREQRSEPLQLGQPLADHLPDCHSLEVGDTC